MNRRGFARKALLGVGSAALFRPSTASGMVPLFTERSGARGSDALSDAEERRTPSDPPNWKVHLLEEKEVLRGWWYPNALFFPDGTILCSVVSVDGKERMTFYSLDGGHSWSKEEAINRSSGEYLDTFGSGCFKQLRDGSIIGLMFHSAVQEIEVKLRQDYKPFIAQVRRASSPRAWLEGRYIDDFARVVIPGLTVHHSDNGKVGLAAIDHGIVETTDGDLLMTMYGTFKEDDLPVPYYKFGFKKTRAWVCISKDRGYSWSYLSTVASPETYRLPEFAEGYCEPDLLLTGKSDLLAVMRTGGHPSPRGTDEWFTPLYANVSHDGGITWGRPWPIFKHGVWPRLLKMKDGTIVCESGRPGVFLLFSSDGGRSWSAPYIITSLHGRFRESPSGYNSIAEVEPGVLSILYDTVDKGRSGAISHVVRMARYKIRKS